MKKLLSILLITITFQYNTIAQPSNNTRTHEFRAVWVATVANIDWPSARNLTVDSQKTEFINLLNMHQSNGMNAIVMQIRPSADAFYPSQYEPWSVFLTGTQGQPPIPYYDPLEFMINECHARNMEFHAWINPYRAQFKFKENPVSPSHISLIKPEWFLTYGEHKYFDPAIPEVRQHTIRVIRDLLDRYNLDGIHMDDYFYPYKIAGKEFPDEESFKKYGNGLNKDDWRRSNCDSIIKNLWDLISTHPNRVKFGISPFGVWRNASKDPLGSNTKAGSPNYDDLYADIRMWLQKGWMDYCVPQLYWEINHPLCDYNILLDWWNKNCFGRDLYIGHGIYRAGGKGWTNANEIPNQIKNLRNYNTTQGSVYFSGKTFAKNPMGWNDSLKNNYYKEPALPPAMTWIDNEKPNPPTVSVVNNSLKASYIGTKAIRGFMIVTGENAQNAKVAKIVYDQKLVINLNEVGKNQKTFIASVSVNNVLSEWVEVK